MKTPQEITAELANHICTEAYHRFNPLTPNVVATDGAIAMAKLCSAFWLLDVIASHTPSIAKDEWFAIAVFDKNSTYEGGWMFRLCDDIPSNKIYAKQKIEFSDFPLDEIKLYVCRQDEYWVILLPSEY